MHLDNIKANKRKSILSIIKTVGLMLMQKDIKYWFMDYHLFINIILC